jgi:RNA polymerase-binding transcription factor DksA
MANTINISACRLTLEAEHNLLKEKITRYESELFKFVTCSINNRAYLTQSQMSQEQLINIINRTREKIGKIKAALQRIDNGSFGKCLACGKTIRLARLQTLPYAEFCIACQTQRDGE